MDCLYSKLPLNQVIKIDGNANFDWLRDYINREDAPFYLHLFNGNMNDGSFDRIHNLMTKSLQRNAHFGMQSLTYFHPPTSSIFGTYEQALRLLVRFLISNSYFNNDNIGSFDISHIQFIVNSFNIPPEDIYKDIIPLFATLLDSQQLINSDDIINSILQKAKNDFNKIISSYLIQICSDIPIIWKDNEIRIFIENRLIPIIKRTIWELEDSDIDKIKKLTSRSNILFIHFIMGSHKLLEEYQLDNLSNDPTTIKTDIVCKVIENLIKTEVLNDIFTYLINYKSELTLMINEYIQEGNDYLDILSVFIHFSFIFYSNFVTLPNYDNIRIRYSINNINNDRFQFSNNEELFTILKDLMELDANPIAESLHQTIYMKFWFD